MSSFVPLAALGAVAAVLFSGLSPWLPIAALPIVFILFDTWFGKLTARTATRSWRSPLWLFVPAQIAFVAACIAASPRWTLSDMAGASVAGGMTLGIFGMLTAHELVHSRGRWERALGTVALGSLFYAHFRVAHVQGHHRFAGRDEDPTIVRRGDGAYRFALRSTARQAAFAYRAAPRAMSVAGAFYLAMLGADAAIAGWRGVACHVAMAAVAIFILETFNYVVHYGLARRRVDGALEPFGAAHSWNVAHRFSNWALLNGGLHAAHHAAPAKDHAALRLDPYAPSLPGGFGMSMCLALVPPLWRRTMNPRVDALMKA